MFKLIFTFRENNASGDYGGAMCHTRGDLTILGTRFGMNTSRLFGGELIVQDQTRLEAVEIYQNEAGQGAGLFIGYPPGDQTSINNQYDGFITSIDSSTFDYNAASFSGGGSMQTMREVYTLINNIPCKFSSSNGRWDPFGKW